MFRVQCTVIPRRKPVIVTLWLAVLLVLFGVACGGGSGSGSGSGGSSSGGSSPPNEDVIRAVHDHLQGKTYTVVETVTEEQRVSCSQVDYDTDPYKGDPYLGKCRGSDGLYGYGYKTVSRQVTNRIQRDCPAPPPVSSPSWSVRELGEERWEVSNTQGRWVVEKVDSGFRIQPQQDC